MSKSIEELIDERLNELQCIPDFEVTSWGIAQIRIDELLRLKKEIK